MNVRIEMQFVVKGDPRSDMSDSPENKLSLTAQKDQIMNQRQLYVSNLKAAGYGLAACSIAVIGRREHVWHCGTLLLTHSERHTVTCD